MLFDLRERLAAQGEMPPLPAGWQSEIVYRSAHGDSFGGDFLVASRSTDQRHLEIALVDVSGKGIEAGTRALLLSGAFGGLLGSVPSADFLPAANQYLLRQGWAEGFATAVQISLDLENGAYEVYSAGHPPAVQFHAGSGRWVLTEASGPVLGIVDEASYVAATGQLLPGDALLVYTDGLVETADRDIAIGIDRLLGAAERLVTRGFSQGAAQLIDVVPQSESDDRALVVLWRQ
jgi:serine phosphatase RsbU (regulator of sigma subunit)